MIDKLLDLISKLTRNLPELKTELNALIYKEHHISTPTGPDSSYESVVTLSTVDTLHDVYKIVGSIKSSFYNFNDDPSRSLIISNLCRLVLFINLLGA